MRSVEKKSRVNYRALQPYVVSFMRSQFEGRYRIATLRGVQRVLNWLGYKDYEGKRLVVDGILGPRTYSSFMRFLEERGLKKDFDRFVEQSLAMRAKVPKRTGIRFRKGNYVYYTFTKTKEIMSPLGKPLNPLPEGAVLSPSDYFLAPRRGGRIHDGLDLHTGEKSLEVRAPYDGKVVAAGYGNRMVGYFVKIRLSNGVRVVFMHLKRRPTLRPGDEVRKGDVLGLTGRSGNARNEDNQVHIEAYIPYKGKRYYLDPQWFVYGKDRNLVAYRS